MKLLLREKLIRLDDETYLNIRSMSAMAIYVVLAMKQITDRGASLSAFEISQDLRGTLSPSTIKKILWEELALNNRKGILLVANRSDFGKKKSNKPETGTQGGWTTYGFAPQNIMTSLFELQDWLKMYIRMMQKGGPKNITLLRSHDLALLQSYYTEGDFKKAFMLYGSRNLRDIGRSISGNARQRLLAERDRIYGSLLMARGEVRSAAHILKQAMIRARKIGDVYGAVGAAGNLAAALRMISIKEVNIAQSVCFDMIQYVHQQRWLLNTTQYGSLIRWLYTTLASDQTIHEQLSSALVSTEEALDVVGLSGEEQYLGEAEIRFRRARAFLVNSDVDKCEEEMEKIKQLLALPSVKKVDWIGKWLPRLQADFFLAQQRTEDARRTLLQGWHMNVNYGFQRAHIAYRMLTLNYVDASMTQGVDILHKQQLGVFSRECRYCGGRPLIDRLRCVINRTWRDAPRSFWF